MTIRAYETPREGERLSASEMQRALWELTHLHNLRAEPPINVKWSAGGPHLRLDLFLPFPAKITGRSGSAYSWVEVEPDQITPGTFHTKDPGRSGTTSVEPAYEDNGSTSVPTNTYVWMRQGRLTEDHEREYFFSYPEATAPPTTPPNLKPIKLTALETTTGKYSWTEQRLKDDGTWEDKPSGTSGDTSANWAVERNDNRELPLNVVVLAEPQTSSPGGLTIWVFDCPSLLEIVKVTGSGVISSGTGVGFYDGVTQRTPGNGTNADFDSCYVRDLKNTLRQNQYYVCRWAGTASDGKHFYHTARYEPKGGCGIFYDETLDEITVETGDLAGAGLAVMDGDEDECYLRVDPGCGLFLLPNAFDPDAVLTVDNGALAGDGLAPQGICSLQVKEGCGIFVGGGGVSVFSPDLAGPGLIPVGDCGLAVATGCGLILSGGAVAFNSGAVAGPGLGIDGTCGLRVVGGCGINVDGAGVSVDNTALAGPGLKPFGACGLEVALCAGCGLKKDDEGCFGIDAVSLAGPGLIPYPTTSSACAIGVCAGCGIEIDNDGCVAVDAEELAGAGLNADGCTLNVYTGCGLEIDGATNKIKVKPEDIQGLGLKAGTGCRIDIDPEVVSTASITYIENLDISVDGCTVTLHLQKQRLTLGQNDGKAVVDVIVETLDADDVQFSISCEDCICACNCDAITTSCCENPIPESLTVEIITSPCACLPAGTTFGMVYDAGSELWVGTVGEAPCAAQFYMACVGGTSCEDFSFYGLSSNCTITVNSPEPGCTCDPLDLTITTSGGCASPCGGTWVFHITETP